MSDNTRVMDPFGNDQCWPLNCGCVLTRYKFDQAYARRVFHLNVPYIDFYCCNRHAIVVFTMKGNKASLANGGNADLHSRRTGRAQIEKDHKHCLRMSFSIGSIAQYVAR